MRGPGLRRMLAAAVLVVPLTLSVASAETPIPALDALRLWRPTSRIEAPPFDLVLVDGKPARLADLRGRVVVLYFWATW